MAARPLALAALLLLSLAAPALAGTATTPEITDASNDQAAGGVIPIAAQPPAGTTSVGLNVDLQAGWITETADALTLTIQVQGSGSASTSSTTTYVFHLEAAGTAYDASAVMDINTPAGTGTITPGGVATGASAAGDHLIVLTVPKSGIGSPAAGAILSNLFIKATGKSAGQASTITDRAPDTDAGANYVLTGGSAGPAKTVYGTLSNTTVSVAQTFTNATTGKYVYNWTQGPASAAIRLAAHGTGNATVLVQDGANATIFQSHLADVDTSLNLTVKPGQWTITLNYTAFKGNVTLSIAPWTPPTTHSGTATSSSTSRATTSGTATATSSSTTKGTPFVGAAAVLVTLAVAMVIARRRLS